MVCRGFCGGGLFGSCATRAARGGLWHGTIRVPARVPADGPGPGRGRLIFEVAEALGVGDQVHLHLAWPRRIGRGLEPGLTSTQTSELAVTKRRIPELEDELYATRRAIEFLGTVVPQEQVRSGRGCSSTGTHGGQSAQQLLVGCYQAPSGPQLARGRPQRRFQGTRRTPARLPIMSISG